MDLRQLETFIEVANLKSFSKAASKLYITQPTVTNHIQSLEKELETLLINRSSKKMSLTDAGNLFYKYAINIINSCEMAKFDLAAFKGRIQGHLHIYSSSVPRKYILPKLLDNFLQDYPDMTFTLADKDSKDVVESILEGDVDFGIIGAKYPSKNLDYIDIMIDNLVVITPNSPLFPKPNYSYLTLEEITQQKILLREEGSATRDFLLDKLIDNKIDIDDLNILAYIEDTEVIKKLVSLGVGIGFESKIGIDDDIKSGKYKVYYIEGINLSRKFYFVYHNKRQLSPLSETFKSFILNYIKDHNI